MMALRLYAAIFLWLYGGGKPTLRHRRVAPRLRAALTFM